MRYDPDLTEPLPWWVGWMDRAERWNKMPWEPFDEAFDCKSSRLFWLQCDAILQSARARHQRWQEKKQAD